MINNNDNSDFDIEVPSEKFISNQFENNLAYAEGQQALVQDAIIKAEVKTDRLTKRTGNVYVEYKSRGADSGLFTTKSDWWIFQIVNEQEETLFSILISTKRLKHIINYGGYRQAAGGDDHTSMGWLVPIKDLIDTNK